MLQGFNFEDRKVCIFYCLIEEIERSLSKTLLNPKFRGLILLV